MRASVASDAPYWNDVAKRYEAAAALLADPAQRTVAEERAKAGGGQQMSQEQKDALFDQFRHWQTGQSN